MTNCQTHMIKIGVYPYALHCQVSEFEFSIHRTSEDHYIMSIISGNMWNESSQTNNQALAGMKY